MKKMLDLFCGTKSMAKAFERAGWETYTVDWDEQFEPTLCCDVNTLTVEKIIELCGGKPDFVHLSPDCSSYSVAAIFHHRRKNEETGELEPITEYAQFCDKTNAYIIDLIVNKLKPKYWTIENPRSGMRKMRFVKDLPRYTITYCFRGDTKIITKDGTYPIGELEDENVIILNSNGEWTQGFVRNYGKQKLMKVTLSRVGKQKIIYATPEHIWLIKGKEVQTKNLKRGDRLDYVKPKTKDCKIINEYVARGFVYGDGWIRKNEPQNGSYAQFCNEKAEMLPYFNGFGGKRWRDDKNACKIIKLCSLPLEWKLTPPSVNDDPSKIFSWIAGYIAADGSVNKSTGQVTLSSANKNNIEIIRTLCRVIGIDTYSPNEFWRKGLGKVETPLYQVTLMKRDIPLEMILREKHRQIFERFQNAKHQARRFSVVSVEETDLIEDVYCVEVPNTHTFALDDGILTHNCQYGDSRQKPTDIWTNIPNPNFKPPCKPGSSCHERAPRGSKTGTQGIKGSKDRSRIPDALCDYIVSLCERGLQDKVIEREASES